MPKLVDIEIDEISGVDKAANRRKFLIIKRDKTEKPMKTENGVQFPAEAYAYVPDPEKPSTWKLRLWETPETKETARQVGMAIAALGPGFRGNKVEIPKEDLPKVKAKVRAAWRKVHPDKSDDEMPEIIRKRGDGMDELTLKDRLWNFVKGLFNSGDGKAKDLVTILDQEQRDEVLWKLTDALRGALDSIMEDDEITDKQAAIKQVLQQFFDALIGSGVAKAGRAISAPRLRMLQQMKELLDQLIADGLKYLEDAGITRPDIEKRKDGDKMPISEEVRKNLPEEVQKYLEELEGKATQVDELTKRVAELEKKDKKDDKKDDAEDIWKGVNPVIRKRMEELEKRAKEAEELAKAEKEKREHQEFLKRAEQYPHVGKAEEVADMLKKAYEVSKEYGEKLEAVFKATNEQVEKSMLFDEIGRSGGAGGSAIQKAEALANEMIQKNTGMTREQAMAKVWIEHPELYAEYEKEVKGGVR